MLYSSTAAYFLVWLTRRPSESGRQYLPSGQKSPFDSADHHSYFHTMSAYPGRIFLALAIVANTVAMSVCLQSWLNLAMCQIRRPLLRHHSPPPHMFHWFTKFGEHGDGVLFVCLHFCVPCN